MISLIKLSLNKTLIKKYIPHMYQVQKNSGNNQMKVFLNKKEKSLVNDIIN